jgi:hypothetical protein
MVTAFASSARRRERIKRLCVHRLEKTRYTLKVTLLTNPQNIMTRIQCVPAAVFLIKALRFCNLDDDIEGIRCLTKLKARATGHVQMVAMTNVSRLAGDMLAPERREGMASRESRSVLSVLVWRFYTS